MLGKRFYVGLFVGAILFVFPFINSANAEIIGPVLRKGEVIGYNFEMKKGDILWNIYEEFYGKPVLKKVEEKLMVPNNIRNPRRIPIGKKVFLPVEDMKLDFSKNVVPRMKERIDAIKKSAAALDKELVIITGKRAEEIEDEKTEQIISKLDVLNESLLKIADQLEQLTVRLTPQKTEEAPEKKADARGLDIRRNYLDKWAPKGLEIKEIPELIESPQIKALLIAEGEIMQMINIKTSEIIRALIIIAVVICVLLIIISLIAWLVGLRR